LSSHIITYGRRYPKYALFRPLLEFKKKARTKKEAKSVQNLAFIGILQGGSDISGILKFFIKNDTTQLKMIRFY
jgi:hypothetical protein